MKNEEVFELVKSIIVKVVPQYANYKIKESESLTEMGINSIERMDIIMAIMEELEMDIPRVELLAPGNIGELVALLVEKITAVRGVSTCR